MNITRLSSKGQVIIPKPLRSAHQWKAGLQLIATDCGDGILLKPKTAFAETNISDVAACLKYSGEPKSLDDMTAAIQKGIQAQHQ